MSFETEWKMLLTNSRRISEYPQENTLEKFLQRSLILIKNYPAETATIARKINDLDYNYRRAIKAIRMFETRPAQKIRDEIHATKTQLVAILQELGGSTMTQKPLSKNIFIVHGHDEGMKERVARIVTQLGLKPIILSEQTSQGSTTIIEKFERHADVSFAVVLLSPDDFAFSKRNTVQFTRARQNVIFEYGYFVGRIGREHVFPLYRKSTDFEVPSDISGIVLNEFDNNDGWILMLIRELKKCGYQVDANMVTP